MASKFTAGMKNFVEVLNQMWDAFAAGPYNALPLTGGTLSGPVISSSYIRTSTQILAGPTDLGNASSLRSPNDSSPGAPWQPYEVLAMGVAPVPGNNPGGRFYWRTRGTPGVSSYVGFSAQFCAYDLANGSSEALVVFSGTGDITCAGRITGGSVLPDVDNSRTVGTAATAYATLYARTGAINTSDARLKCGFRDLSTAEIAAARDLVRAIGIYRWRDAVEEKDQAAREHIGPTVQRAIEIMQAHGLDPFNYGFICYDAWGRQTVEHPAVEAAPANGEYPAIEARAAYTEVTLEAGDRYAFRYDELAMFIAAGQEARLAALEAVA